MNQTSIIIQVVSAILAAAILTNLFINGRRTKAVYSYIITISLLLFWNLAEIVLLMSQSAAEEMLALKLKFLPVVYIGVSWLYFCLNITHSRLAQNKTLLRLMICVPAIFYSFLLTNDWHHLFYIEVIFKTRLNRGPVFWIHTAESYFCILFGTIHFFQNLKKKIGVKGSIWLILGVAMPMTANVLMLTGVIPNEGFDITAQATLVTMIFFGIAVYQKRFLNLIPMAARYFIENTADGIIILDQENVIVGMNESANHLLPGLNLKLYDPASKISSYILSGEPADTAAFLAGILEGAKTSKVKKGSLKWHGLDVNVEIRALTGFKQAATGRMIVLVNRSEEQQLLNEIQEKNTLLMGANERLMQSNNMLTEANTRLEQFSATIEELAVSRERNRFGREVHDTVGHTLTLLIALAENAKTKLAENQQEIKNTLDMSMELSRQALNDIRSCLKGIDVETWEKADLTEWMNHLVKFNQSSGIQVELSISEEFPVLDAAKVTAIYRICQESVTNAIRHGHAKTINIIIKRQTTNSIRIYIFNDGEGCREIVKGYGLTGMEERITRLGGSISFGSDGEKGFNIIAEIPA